MELISEERLRKNRIKYFEKKFDEAYLNLEAKPPLGSNEIDDADYNLIRFKDMYPCYIKIIEILRNNQDVNQIRSLVVMELMLYFDRVHRGVIWENDEYREKKDYSSEFKKIFKDLPRMLYLAKIEIRKQKIESSKTDVFKTENVVDNSPKITYKKPGRKSFSENDLIGLKYQIIRKFYESENPYSSKSRFPSIGAFQKEIGQIEKINPHCFKNSYNKIGNEDLIRYCKEKPRLVKKLVESNSFQNYPKCSVFISQFDRESN